MFYIFFLYSYGLLSEIKDLLLLLYIPLIWGYTEEAILDWVCYLT